MINREVMCGLRNDETADETTGPHGTAETKSPVTNLWMTLASRYTSPD